MNEQKTELNKKTPLFKGNTNNEDLTIENLFHESNINNYISIPGIVDIDWATKVRGNGMYPKYSNGDILLCRDVKDSFIQWGKVYVIITKAGMMVRKLKPSTKDGHYTAETFSDNYPPFDIPTNDIIGLAIVIASIQFE